uniref:M23ase beta-sheet core domain-containing protein n=1 Tax=candidate division WOR-3 bacterium TaxID=2052148 RepID=A0A7V3PU60_UNCW3
MRLWRLLIPGLIVLLFSHCAVVYTSEPRFGRGRRRVKPVVQTKTLVTRHPMDEYQGKLPWPVQGTIVSSFGIQVDPKYGTKTKNSGVDISCLRGSPIKAVWQGTVSYADEFIGQGLMIILEHGGGYYTVYSRLNELKVTAGQKVNAGDVLALSGDLLHFEIRIGGKAVDPLVWLKVK